MSSIPGQAHGRLGRYELIARLATGGMGEIFLARLEGAAGFEKLYVIKRVLPHLADDARFRAMLVDEARIAARMSHPNICQVYELGEDRGQLFIAMEYLEGLTLLPILRHAARARQPLALGFVAAVLQQTADALHYAHELTERDGTPLHFVHRDVTPSNLLVTQTGVIKVLDFGIAKAKDASAHTQDGTVKGKYAYMAPEQLRSEHADRRADIFSLAVVGFEMLALRRLFQRKTDYLTFRAVMELPIPELREFRPDLPPGMAAVFTRALERDPARRFPTARQFASALSDALHGHTKVWTAAEVSDYLRHELGAELERREAAVDTVIRGGDGDDDDMPVVTLEDAPTRGGDDLVDDFPSIDTGVHDLAPAARRPVGAGSDAYPVDTGSDTSGTPLTELAPAPGTLAREAGAGRKSESVVVQLPSGRRGVLWPLFAVAIVAVGAVALWFMWQKIRSQQQASGGIVIVDHGGVRATGPNVIETGSATAGAATAGQATAGSATAGAATAGAATDDPAGSAATVAGSSHSGDRGKIPSTDNEIKAHVKGRVAARLGAINDCMRDHSATASSPPRALVLEVTAAGRASAKVQPASVDASELGACIRRVAEAVDYGRLGRDAAITIAIEPE